MTNAAALQSHLPFALEQWVNLQHAPPQYGQREYSLMLSRNIASKGITSPPPNRAGKGYGVPKQSA